MRRAPRALIALTLLGLLATSGCIGGGASPSASPTTSPSGSSSASSPAPTGLPAPVAQAVFQTASGGASSKDLFVHTSVYGLYRQGTYVTLVLGMGYQGDPGGASPVSLPSVMASADTPGFEADGLTLVDPPAKKAYLVARTTDGSCVCSHTQTLFTYGRDVKEGIVHAVFAAPPSGVNAMDVVVPHAGVLPNVPVTDGAAPSGGSPTATVASPALPSQPPARADVVDINTPIANLDKSVTQERDRLLLAADVLFKFDKSTLTAKGRARVAEASGILKARAKNMVKVDGYTDSLGSDSYNLKLSDRRAQTVEGALKQQLGGSGLTFTATGFGERNPVAPNTYQGQDNPKGRALNRRVEVLYEPNRPSPSPTATTSTTTGPAPTASAGGGGTPTPGQVIASREVTSLNGNPVKYKVEVFRLYRHGGLATLDFGVQNDGTGSAFVGSLFSRDKYQTVSGVTLADVPGKKLYLTGSYPLQAGKQLPNSCLCTYNPYSVGPGQTAYLTASFAAPPAGQKSIDVRIPGMKPFKDVPITG